MTEAQEHLWGAKAIARGSGLSTGMVYKLAGHPDAPISRPAGCGRLYANRDELRCWLRKKPKFPNES
jgi:hypothetical protein